MYAIVRLLLKKKKNLNFLFYFYMFWPVVIVIFSFIIVLSYAIEMPYQSWLDKHMTYWLSIINVIIFGILFATAPLPRKLDTLKQLKIYYLNLDLYIISAFLLRSSFRKGPKTFHNIIIGLSLILFLIIKRHYKKKNSANQQDGKAGEKKKRRGKGHTELK